MPFVLAAATVGAIAGSMLGGSSDETTVETNILNEVVNETLTQTTLTNTNAVTSVVTNAQTIEIIVNGTVECENFNVLQNMDTDVKFVNDSSQISDTALKAALDARIDASVSQDADISREFLSGLGANTQDQILADIRNNIRNSVSNIVTQDNINRSVSSVEVVQDQSITINGTLRGKNCNFSQDSVVSQQMEVLSEQIAQDVTETSVSYEGSFDVSQKIVKVATGPSLFGSAGISLLVCLLSIPLCCGASLYGTSNNPEQGGNPTKEGFKGMILGLCIFIIIVVVLSLAYNFMYNYYPWEDPDCVDDRADCDPDAAECNMCCDPSTTDCEQSVEEYQRPSLNFRSFKPHYY